MMVNPLYNWFDKQDITSRRLKHTIIWILVIGTILSLMFGLLVVLVSPQSWATANFWLGQFLQAVENWVAQFKVINPSEFVTILAAIVAADVPVIIATKLILKEPKPLAPDLRINNASPDKDRFGRRFFKISVLNNGETAALDCQARIIVSDIRKKDVVDIPRTNAMFTTKKFEKYTRTHIAWGTRLEELTIRSGDIAELDAMRFVPKKKQVPEHFEIPSVHGWKPICVALKPSHFYGKFTIVPLNGKRSERRFQTRPDKVEGGWFFELE